MQQQTREINRAATTSLGIAPYLLRPDHLSARRNESISFSVEFCSVPRS